MQTILKFMPSPSQNAGWPWTDESMPLPPLMPNGKHWPKISIVTPSYNQGQFLEETIRSVLLQNYPNLEYIVIDGGSTDSSVEIIKKYQQWLTYWVSERDNGQANAINKGIKKATGDIIAYLNSDDTLVDGALLEVIKAFAVSDNSKWVVGKINEIDLVGNIVNNYGPNIEKSQLEWIFGKTILPQPSTFLKKDLFDTYGLFKENMHYSFDREYWLRLLFRGIQPILLETSLANFRLHQHSKTCCMDLHFQEEDDGIAKLYIDMLPDSEKEKALKRQIQEKGRKKIQNSLTSNCNLLSKTLITEILKSPGLLVKRETLGAIKKCLFKTLIR